MAGMLEELLLSLQPDLRYMGPQAQEAREAAARRLAAGGRGMAPAAPAAPNTGMLADPSLWGADYAASFEPNIRQAPQAPTMGDMGTTPAEAFPTTPTVADMGATPAEAMGQPPAKVATQATGNASNPFPTPIGTAPATDFSGVPRQAPAAAAASPASAGSNFWPDLMQRLTDNRGTLLALAGGFAGAPNIGTGMRRAFTQAAPIAAKERELAKKNTPNADLFRALVARGMPAQEAIAALRDPDLKKAAINRYFGEGKTHEVGGRLVQVGPDGQPKVIADFSSAEAKGIPSGYRRAASGNLEFIPGGPADPAVKRASGDRQNAPPGYRWADPNDPSSELVAIPGGPAEKVDATVAARLGLAQSYLDQLPSIKEAVKKGEATGLINSATGHFNIGRAGELRRQAASGAEALLRNLTGAGMNLEEASKYVRRYEIENLDTKETVLSKMNQLERELKYTMEAVKKGRGGTIKLSNDGQSLSVDDAPAAPTGLGVGSSTSVNGVTIKRLQ